MEFAAGWVLTLNSQAGEEEEDEEEGEEEKEEEDKKMQTNRYFFGSLVWLVAFVGIVISQFWSDERTK